MSLIEQLRKECIGVGTEASQKQAVLREIVTLAKKSPLLSGTDADDIFKALREREELGSTGFGGSIAIPHCALENIKDFVVGILTCSQGVDFGSLDGNAVKILVFIIGPKQKRNEHIHLLSGISRVLSQKSAITEILAQKDPEAVRESFLRYVADEIDTSRQTEKSLIHIFIQKEELFEKILQVFSEMQGSSVSVVDANDAAYYLNKLPLFSGFLNGSKKGYHKTIVAVVNKGLANEVLRQINTMTGGISRSAGVMVTFQELAFSQGSLNF